MERRDYLLRQIHNFTQVLLKLTGLIDEGKFHEGIDVVDDFFSSQVDINISELESLSEDDALNFLIETKKYEAQEIELVAEILYKHALSLEANNQTERATINFKICRRLYIFVDESGGTFSLERINLIEKLDKKIENG